MRIWERSLSSLLYDLARIVEAYHVKHHTCILNIHEARRSNYTKASGHENNWLTAPTPTNTTHLFDLNDLMLSR